MTSPFLSDHIVIGTHDGKCHLDDAFCGAAFALTGARITTVRSRDPSVLADCDVVFDVGGGEFDGHSKDASSFSLLWPRLKGRVCRALGVPEDDLSDFVSELDLHDSRGTGMKGLQDVAKLVPHLPDDLGYEMCRLVCQAHLTRLLAPQPGRSYVESGGYAMSLVRIAEGIMCTAYDGVVVEDHRRCTFSDYLASRPREVPYPKFRVWIERLDDRAVLSLESLPYKGESQPHWRMNTSRVALLEDVSKRPAGWQLTLSEGLAPLAPDLKFLHSSGFLAKFSRPLAKAHSLFFDVMETLANCDRIVRTTERHLIRGTPSSTSLGPKFGSVVSVRELGVGCVPPMLLEAAPALMRLRWSEVVSSLEGTRGQTARVMCVGQGVLGRVFLTPNPSFSGSHPRLRAVVEERFPQFRRDRRPPSVSAGRYSPASSNPRSPPASAEAGAGDSRFRLNEELTKLKSSASPFLWVKKNGWDDVRLLAAAMCLEPHCKETLLMSDGPLDPRRDVEWLCALRDILTIVEASPAMRRRVLDGSALSRADPRECDY